MSYKIALVDDDQNILTSLSMSIKAEGFAVKTFNNGKAALDEFDNNPPDLAVLDVKMPNMNGIELLGEIKKSWNFPVIFLTSKDDEDDALLGFQSGADDYITKPFSIHLLIARIRACLHRYAPEDSQGERITYGLMTLDDTRHLCKWKDKEIDLTVTEYLLLKSLIQRPGNTRSRAALIDGAYGQHSDTDDRTIDSHIKRIRQKLRQADGEFNRIETLYGVGYRYKKEEADEE